MIDAVAIRGAPSSRSGPVNLTRRALALARRDPLGVLAVLLVLLLCVLALLVPYLPLRDPKAISADAVAGIGPSHWLGTDELGRDILSRTLWGSRVSLFVAVVVSLLSSVLSVGIGLFSGYIGGWIDVALLSIIDVFMAIPWIILVMALVLIVHAGGVYNVAFSLSLLYGVRNARVVRTVVIGLKSSAFIDAARATGAAPSRVVLRHIAPNTVGPVMVLISTIWGTAVIAEATLSFLGLGASASTPSWGQIISQARPWMEQQPFYVLGAGAMLAVGVWSLNIAGDLIRDVADPRLRSR